MEDVPPEPPQLQADVSENVGVFRANNPENLPPQYTKPDIKKAERFFEQTRPHRIEDPEAARGHRLARIGEDRGPDGKGAEPYSVMDPYGVLNEFGIGVALYFRQLLALFWFLLASATVMLISVFYNMDFNGPGTPTILEGSVLGATRSDLVFNHQVAPDIACTVILIFFAVAAKRAEDEAVEAIDVSMQTPSDYTIEIKNPPPNVKDPEAYKKFFEEKFHGADVVFVTVALDNGALMQALARKRLLTLKRNALHSYNVRVQRPGASAKGAPRARQQDLVAWQLSLQRFGLCATTEFYDQKIAEVDRRIAALAKRKYNVRRVFVTFNFEEEQRRVIQKMQAGSIFRILPKLCGNCIMGFSCWEQIGLPPLFEGRLLLLAEAQEPSDYIWHNYQYSAVDRFCRNVLAYLINGGLMVALFFANKAVNDADSGIGAALFISLVNMALPFAMKTTTTLFEYHVSNVDVQASIVLKMVATRFLNTAIFMYIVTDYGDTFSEENLNKIQTVLIVDCIFSPVFRALNVADWLKRKILAPRQNTQIEMDLLFQGAYWNLAERYTDMLKTCFVGMFYLALLPSGLFITAGAMLMNYWVDKWCLIKHWRRPPQYDQTLGVLSRHFMVGILFSHCIMSRIFFVNWAYEDSDEKIRCKFLGCQIPEELDPNYEIFNTNSAQEKAYYAYYWLGLMVFILGIVFYGLSLIYNFVAPCFCKIAKFRGEATGKQYREVAGIDSYVPSIHPQGLLDPLLAADVATVPAQNLPLAAGALLHFQKLCLHRSKDLPSVPDRAERLRLFGKTQHFARATQDDYRFNVPTASGFGQGFNQAAQGVANVFGGVMNMAGAVVAAPLGGLLNPNQIAAIPQQQQGPQEDPGAAAFLGASRGGGPAIPQAFLASIGVRQGGGAMAGGAGGGGQQADQVRGAAVEELPDGWEMAYAEDGRPYYIDHNTATTHWEPPVDMTSVRSVEVPETAPQEWQGEGGGTAAPAVDADDLPAGWELARAQDGRPYYIDHNTQSTHWELPVWLRPLAGGGRQGPSAAPMLAYLQQAAYIQNSVYGGFAGAQQPQAATPRQQPQQPVAAFAAAPQQQPQQQPQPQPPLAFQHAAAQQQPPPQLSAAGGAFNAAGALAAAREAARNAAAVLGAGGRAGGAQVHQQEQPAPQPTLVMVPQQPQGGGGALPPQGAAYWNQFGAGMMGAQQQPGGAPQQPMQFYGQR